MYVRHTQFFQVINTGCQLFRTQRTFFCQCQEFTFVLNTGRRIDRKITVMHFINNRICRRSQRRAFISCPTFGISRIHIYNWEKHSVSRLVGAPPGYVGYDEGGQLTEAIRRKPYSVVLFDEIEKAHPDVFNILLQVLDDGRLTDNKGRVVNFKNTIIIMTSNMGSSYIQSQMEKLHGSNKEEVIEETKKEVMNMLKKTIRPEFLNRIDETIMFLPLNEKEIKQIVLLQIKGVQKMLAENGVELQLTEGALNFLSQVGYDPEFGARPVKRAIQRYLLNDLSKKLLSQEVDRSKAIIVDADGDGLVFRN